MLRKIYLACSVILIGFITANAQNSGSIKGRVLDKSSGEPLPFANVVAESNGRQAGGAQTDFDGNFTIKPLNPGTYDIKASFVGYSAAQVNAVLVSADKITFQDLKLNKGAVDINTVVIEDYAVPLIDKGQTSTQQTITAEQIEAAPTRDVKSIAATSAGIVQKDEGDALNVRGSRDNATDYIVDGVRVRGTLRVSSRSVDQITIKTGGLEAQYGDNTGGVIVVTTKGPQEEFGIGVEAVTSELFDEYGYNLYNLTVSGPLLSKKTETGKRTIMDYYIGGEYQKEKDPDPSAIGLYKLKDGVLDDLKSNPLTLSSNGLVLEPAANYITLDDVEKIKAKQNFANKSYRFNAKFNISPWKNIDFLLGGNYDKSDGYLFSWNNALYNYEHNENRIETNSNAFIRFTQKFQGALDNEKSSSLIKSAFYSIQFDYSNRDLVRQDKNHQDRYFDYGYIGTFKSEFTPGDFSVDLAEVNDTNIVVQHNLPLTDYSFTAGGVNPEAQAYTSQFYSFANNDVSGISEVLQYNALPNGYAPNNILGIWNGFGSVFNLYQTSKLQQYSAKLNASADIKNHNFVLGFEYEQREERLFGINPRGLWILMNNYANLGLDADGDGATYNITNDTAFWIPTYNNPGTTSGFYQNVRARLGLGLTDYADIDSYDRNKYSLDLFTPDEILNGGNSLVGYYGYDYSGKKLNKSVSFKDFFEDKDDNGNFTRNIDAFRPNYMAFYLQDKFAVNDLIFNIGVRVDRFDANQKVLSDPYLLFPAKTVGELSIPGLPDNIGADFVPYVTDKFSPSVGDIIGYRDGETWYDKNGEVVVDPTVLAQINSSTQIYPYLEDTRLAAPNAITSEYFNSDKSFKDYEPQISVMPRIAFSFPISDEAQFFAHYDILTQRPPDRLRNDPTAYLFWDGNQGALFNNPNLKPEKTTDYEIGFKQTLSKSSAMSISAFYRELRDMVQQVQRPFAYPITYITYGNFDFGTVKGLIFSYDLRRTGNIRMNINYTLQFAEGTGSNDGVANKLLANGLPNLRSLTPLDFDQRHVIVTSIDYRYGSGKDYNGPMIFGKQFFADAGANLVFRVNSGTPYTSERDITNQAGNLGLQQIGAGVLSGSVNGSRLPWQYRLDLKVDKGFSLKIGKESSKSLNFNIYFQVQNLLNTKNVINVYRATGVPDDDGYVASAVGQSYVNGLAIPLQQSYTDQYSMKVTNPDNYSLPRRMRLGLLIDF